MKNRKNNLVFVLIGLGILAAISAICFFVFHLPDLWSQLLAIIASAFLGAGVTAWITNRLLQNQSDLEEDKEKNIKIHENKIETYSNFISKMWNTMEDNEITEKEITEIRTELFNKLIFYLNNEQINKIEKNFTSLRGKFDNDSNSTLRVFAKITSILRSDLYTSEEASENKDNIVSNTLNLWNSFLPQKPTEEPNSENPQTNSTSLSGIKQIEEDCYHFNIGDKVTQYKIFANGISALVLWEYNETWRRERLETATRNNSLIFLYLSGGAGYVGVFRAKGWICFESNGDGFIKDKKASDGVLQDKDEKFEELLCVDEFISDGATSVAYLMVEPLIFYEKGVGRISVYRDTISSYDKGYARITLSRFDKMLEEHEEEIGKIARTEDLKTIIDYNSKEFTEAQRRRLERLDRFRLKYDTLKDEEEQKKWSEKIKKLEGKIGAEAMKKAADYKTRPITLECNINEFTNILNRYDIHPSKIVNGEWEE